MRLPNRRPGKYTFPTFDPYMTQAKFDELQSKLQHIKEVSLPRAIAETQRLGENGDYSENAEYQIAKGKLRGLLRAVDELQYHINHAQVISPPRDNDTVQIGHTVTIAAGDAESTFRILGPTEADPTAGIISYLSPLGALLLGHRVGDVITYNTGDRTLTYTVRQIA